MLPRPVEHGLPPYATIAVSVLDSGLPLYRLLEHQTPSRRDFEPRLSRTQARIRGLPGLFRGSLSHWLEQEQAVAAIDEMIRSGLANPGDLDIRQVDEDGATVDVSTPSVSAAACAALAAGLPLTPRELEVLELLAEGLSYRETAKRLFISHATVKLHLRHLRAKLEADARTRPVAPALLETLTA